MGSILSIIPVEPTMNVPMDFEQIKNVGGENLSFSTSPQIDARNMYQTVVLVGDRSKLLEREYLIIPIINLGI